MTPRLSTLERLRDRLAAHGIDPADADRFFWEELDADERAAILEDFRTRSNDRRYLAGVAPFIPARRKRAPAPTAPRRIVVDEDSEAFERGNEALRSVDAEVFLEALVPDCEPARGRCRCPWPNDHFDRNPSASYNGTAFYCFTCGEGGGIFELGAALTGRTLRGPDFLEVRRFLAERILAVTE